MGRMHPVHMEGAPPRWRTRTGVAVIGFVLVSAFYLLREHGGHALGTLPYLLILACPLMHLFMHRGHPHHGGSADTPPDEQRRS